jgi:hypothetical protein
VQVEPEGAGRTTMPVFQRRSMTGARLPAVRLPDQEAPETRRQLERKQEQDGDVDRPGALGGDLFLCNETAPATVASVYFRFNSTPADRPAIMAVPPGRRVPTLSDKASAA